MQHSVSTTTLNTFLISKLIPREFRIPPSLEHAYDKSTLKSELINRILVFTTISITSIASDTILFLQQAKGTSLAWNLPLVIIDLLVIILVITLSLCLPRNPLWQKGLTFFFIILCILVPLPHVPHEGTTRIFLTVICSFLSFQMSALSCIIILLIMEWAVVLGPVMIGFDRLVVLQTWLVGLILTDACLQTVFQVQKQSRRSFLTRHFMQLKKKEMEKETDQMDFLLRQMLPKQIIEELRDNLIIPADGLIRTPRRKGILSSVSAPNMTPMEKTTDDSSQNQSFRGVSRSISARNMTASAPQPIPSNSLLSDDDNAQESVFYRTFKSASVTFVKIRNFLHITRHMTAVEIIKMLSEIFSQFDEVIEANGLYRIKTISENYMFASGVPEPDSKHLHKNFAACLSILKVTESISSSFKDQIRITCGMAGGELICGVIPYPSLSRVQYDAYGVSTIASRLSNCAVYESQRSCIHVPSDNAAELDLSDCETTGPHKMLIKGRGLMDVVRIFGKKPHSASSIDPIISIDSPKKDIKSKSSRIMHSLSALIKKEDASERKYMNLKDVERYVRNANKLPLDKMAATLPRKWVRQYEKSLSHTIIPGLLCFSDWRFNSLYLKHHYRSCISSARMLFLTCMLVYLVGAVSNMCLMYLYPQTETLDHTSKVFFELSGDRFAKLTWSRILLVRYAIGFPILLLTCGWVFTPLFGLHWIGYNFFCLLASCGLLLAQFTTVVILGSGQFDQYLLIAFMILISNVHGCYHLLKVFVLVIAFIVYVWYFVFAAIFFSFHAQALNNLMLGSLVFVICIHFQYLFRFRSMQAFLYSALSVQTLQQLNKRKSHTNQLLNSLLPKKLIMRAVKRLGKKSQIVGDFVESMSVLTADIVSFTEWSANLCPRELFGHLNVFFSTFDSLADNFQVYRLQLVGDMYSCCAGVISPLKDHQKQIVLCGFKMLEFIREYGHVEFRIGVHCGSGVSGVLNTSRLQWDVFGMTKKVSELMEQTGEAGRVHISTSMHRVLSEHEDEFVFEKRAQPISAQLLDNPIQTYYVCPSAPQTPVDDETKDIEFETAEGLGTTTGHYLHIPGSSISFHRHSTSSLFSSNPDESMFSIYNDPEDDEIESYISIEKHLSTTSV